jgi:hypothetical protein
MRAWPRNWGPGGSSRRSSISPRIRLRVPPSSSPGQADDLFRIETGDRQQLGEEDR